MSTTTATSSASRFAGATPSRPARYDERLGLLRQRVLLPGRARGRLRRGALRHRAARRAARRRGARVARLRQPDRRRRPARGRDGARPRLGRRDRRHPLGEARRPDRPRVRPRHDRRDARARARRTRRGRRRRTRSSSRASSRTSRCRRESVDVVISNCVINLSTDKAGGARPRSRACCRPGGRVGVSDVVAEDRLSPDGARRARLLRRLHRGRAVEERVRGRASRPPASRTCRVEFTHEVADGMHGAIVSVRPSSRG